MDNKYFNNAGAGVMSEKTFGVITDHLRLEMNIGGYSAAKEKNVEVAEFYDLSAKLLNAASSKEIAFIDSASRGWNLVMYGLHISSADTIITLSSEYGTNLLTIFDIAKKSNCSVKIIPCDNSGKFDLSDVEEALASGGTVLAVSHVAAQGSIVNPVLALGRLAEKYNATYIVDGCQAVGQIKVDVQQIKCAAYITAGRKWLRGPRGTGLLYVKSGSSIRTPQIDLASADLVFGADGAVTGVSVRTDAKQFELWEKSTASLLGLTNAIAEYLDYGEDRANIQIVRKADVIRESISANPKLQLVGERHAPVGIAGFYLINPSEEERMKTILADCNYNVSYMGTWDCPMAFPKNGANSIVRISPHYYTSDDAVNSLCHLLSSF